MKCNGCSQSFGSGEGVEIGADFLCWACSINAPATTAMVAAVKPIAADAKPVRTCCPHYSVIREFFSTARESGLDTSEAARDRMRGSLGMLLGRRIESRADMSAADWAFATNAVRINRVWW